MLYMQHFVCIDRNHTILSVTVPANLVYFKCTHNANNFGLGSNNNIAESRLKSCVIGGDLCITVINSANLTDQLVVALVISLGDAGITSKHIPSK